LPASADALFAEVAAGRPVLVMQNLLIPSIPRWHYAVVVGYEPGKNRVILRSGTEREREESLRRFLRSWNYADNWAFVSLSPGELPATAEVGRYMQTLIDAEGRISAAAIAKAYDAGLQRWPDNADFWFVAANAARADNAFSLAAERYLRATELDPGHPGALNNLADLLLNQGCPQAARQKIDQALRLEAAPEVRAVIKQTAAEIAAANADPGVAAACELLTQR